MELYPCRAVCGLGTAQQSEDQRRAYRCALPGFDQSKWGDGSESPRYYMGRLPIYGEPDPEDDLRAELGEDPMRPRDSHDEGCPGAWSRCEFVLSLSRYERIILENGVIPSPVLDRTDDPLVLEAIQFIETERVRARAHWQQILDTARET